MLRHLGPRAGTVGPWTRAIHKLQGARPTVTLHADVLPLCALVRTLYDCRPVLWTPPRCVIATYAHRQPQWHTVARLRRRLPRPRHEPGLPGEGINTIGGGRTVVPKLTSPRHFGSRPTASRDTYLSRAKWRFRTRCSPSRRTGSHGHALNAQYLLCLCPDDHAQRRLRLFAPEGL